MTIEVRLYVWLQDGFESRKLTHLLGVEVCWLIQYKSVTVAKNVGREPSAQTEATSTDHRSKSTLYQSLTSLEILTGNRHLGFLCQFPHSRNIHSCIRSTHDKRSTLCQGSISIAHRWSNMLTVVSLHRLFQSSQCAMNLLIYWYIDFCRSSPDYNDTGTTVLLLEVTDILTESFYHLPTGLAILHIVTSQTLRIILVERSLHRNDFLQFIFYRINILFLQYLCIHRCLIGILRINIPSSKHDIIQFCERYDVLIMQILLVGTTPHTNLIILSHRTNRLCQALASHQHTGYKSSSNCTTTYNHNTKFAICWLYIVLFHHLLLKI